MARPAAAQTVTDGRAWGGFSMQGRLPGPKWRWSIETLTRSRDGLSTLDTFVARLLVGYDVSTRTAVWGGYAHSANFPAGGGVTNEHRVFQQLSWTARSGAVTLALRTRVEQRFIEGNSGMALRARQQVRVSRQLGGSRFSVVGYDEIFAHANRTTRFARGIDQNRAFAGISRTLGRASRVEVGYLNQFIVSGEPNRMNHVAFGGVNLAW